MNKNIITLSFLWVGFSAIAMERPTLEQFLNKKEKPELVAFIQDLDLQLKAREVNLDQMKRNEKAQQHVIELLESRLAESEQEKMKAKQEAQRAKLQLQRFKRLQPSWLHNSMS